MIDPAVLAAARREAAEHGMSLDRFHQAMGFIRSRLSDADASEAESLILAAMSPSHARYRAGAAKAGA